MVTATVAKKVKIISFLLMEFTFTSALFFFPIGSAIVQLFVGLLGDSLGRKKVKGGEFPRFRLFSHGGKDTLLSQGAKHGFRSLNADGVDPKKPAQNGPAQKREQSV